MLFIDKIVAKTPKGLCVFVGIVCIVLSIIFKPYTEEEQYIDGIITEYEENIRIVRNPKGGKHNIEFFYIIINSTQIYMPSHLGLDVVKGNESYWKEKLEGKRAKVCYIGDDYYYLHDIELEDGSYSYHDPHEISYYDVGWFPFCITAPIALFCIFVILRFFYLLIFASDERRELVFGDKDYNPF